MSIKRVIVDTREPELISSQSFGAPVTASMLDCGDVWITTDAKELLIFERKTPGDLLASIRDGRLFAQVCAMREQTEWAYLVITGLMGRSPDGYVIVNGNVTGWKWNAIQGVLAEVQERGVTVWQVDCDREFGEALQAIARRDRQGIKPIMPRVETQKVSPAEQILMALPGIGHDRAGDLLGGFAHVPVLALTWLTDLHAYGEVSNIGKATKRNVRKALGMTDDMELVIVTKDRDLGMKAVVQVEAADPLAERLITL